MVSMENVALWLRVYSVFSIQCICMSKDNLNYPGIKVNLDHIIMEKKKYGSVKIGKNFFSEIFLFLKKWTKLHFFNFIPISFSEIKWGCFAKLFYTKISPEKFNQIICYIKFQ